MIITGGTVFIRQADQLPLVTMRAARVVMGVCEPADMATFTEFLSQRVASGSHISGCTFITLEAWARIEARERLANAKSDARNDTTPGWARRLWQQLTTR